MDPERRLIERCLNGDRAAQKELYGRYAGRMNGICQRYAGNALEAQDILQEGFVRAFQGLYQFRFRGSFEGWLRRIFINTAITLARRELKHRAGERLDQVNLSSGEGLEGLSRLCHKELLELIRQLPPGYRTVFNLYVIDRYSHREIGRLLKISVNTSKSQLSAARKSLRELLNKAGYDDGKERP